MSLEKAKIGDAIYDVTTEKELMEHPELFGQYTAVRNNDGYIYPVRNRFDNRPGVYMTGGMNIYIQPQGSERSMYSEQNIINFREASNLKEIIQSQQKLASEERSILTTIDNLFVPKVGANDDPEMKAIKEAIISKHIDLDKYGERFGVNYNNDKRLLGKGSITFRKLKDICNALDIKATLILEDNAPDVPNPIGTSISAELTGSYGDGGESDDE